MPNAEWTLAPGTLDSDEEENEYNPVGYWLSNTETNSVFIMPEDLESVYELIKRMRP